MTEDQLRQFISKLFRQFLTAIPLLIGLVHQVLMWFDITDQIYVFLDPPGHIGPWVSLEVQWWLLLLIITAASYFMIAADRISSLPTRFAYPLYAYLLFLLIFVKPV